MRYQVLLTRGAEQDIEEIHRYLAADDSPGKADHVLEKLLEATESLSALPERGPHPQELLTLGIREYRQTFFKPYRIIYRVIGKQVVIYLIADGRRDMQSLLFCRLLSA